MNRNCLKFIIVLVVLMIHVVPRVYSQTDSTKYIYEKTFLDIKEAINPKNDFSFKQICFLSENTFFKGQLDFRKFNNRIKELTGLVNSWMIANPLKNYHYPDSLNFHKNFAIYSILKDSITIIVNDTMTFIHSPYIYDFNDYFGYENWSNMFVTKLLASHKGNCHSLPYLYKILADELGATCWLSLAPNHMYIKNRCQQIGWYNTELTSGEFPIDAWIATSGYVPVDAIRNGIYMDTLSNQQAIALCVLDLAKGYEFQTKNYYDGFIIKCCDLVLQYHPVNVQAMLLKAETLKHIYEKQKAERQNDSTAIYNQMERLYIKLFELGYREMPEKMYMQWLRSVTEQQNKYGNKQLKETLKNK